MEFEFKIGQNTMKIPKMDVEIEVTNSGCFVVGVPNRDRMLIKFAKKVISYEQNILKARKNGIVKECVKERRTSKGIKEGLETKQDFLYPCRNSQKRLEQLSTTGYNVGDVLIRGKRKIKEARGIIEELNKRKTAGVPQCCLGYRTKSETHSSSKILDTYWLSKEKKLYLYGEEVVRTMVR